MQNIQIFNFNSNQVRLQIIEGKEYFCAKDVTDALAYSNGRDAIEKHCKTKGVAKHDALTNGGIQKLTFIDEANVLRLIVNSKLPSAEKFEAWVFEEILPQIRKTGKFEVQQSLPQNYIQALECLIIVEKEKLALENTVSEQQNTIQVLTIESQNNAEENAKLKTTIQDFFKGAELFTRRQVCHFLGRQGIEKKEQDITDFLNKKRWLCKGEHNLNKATADSCRFGWFVNDISTYETNGRKKTSEYGKFTVDGLIGIYETFKCV
jgi:prophage antirepressor-like protein